MLKTHNFWSGTSRFRRLSALLLVAGAAACAPIAAPGDIDAYRRSVANSDFARSAVVATALSRPDSEGRASDLQWALNAGSALFHAGEYDRAIAMFDVAENLMSTRDTQSTNLQRVYRYGAYDAVMVNTYKALAMLASGNHDGARVEFTRPSIRHTDG